MKEKIDIEDNNNKNKLKISLKLNKYKYSPSEEIEGFIIILPNDNFKLEKIIESFEFNLILKEKIEYKCTENYSTTVILDKKLLDFKDYKGNDNSKIVKFPIKYNLPGVNNENFHPSFYFSSSNIGCFVTHSFCIEISSELYKSSISKNIFIRKLPSLSKSDKTNNNNNLYNTVFGDKTIKKAHFLNSGTFTYYIKAKKAISYKDKFDIEIYIDQRELRKMRVKSIIMKIKRHIYLYNKLNLIQDSLESSFEPKKIELNKNIKNSTIIESFELPDKEFISLSSDEIQNIKFKSKYNFTPPIKNKLFKCEYNLKIIFNFSSNFVEDKEIIVPIDYYDPEYIEEKDINDKSNEQNKINNINNDSSNIGDFVEITYDNFIKTINGKDNSFLRKNEHLSDKGEDDYH